MLATTIPILIAVLLSAQSVSGQCKTPYQDCGKHSYLIFLIIVRPYPPHPPPPPPPPPPQGSTDFKITGASIPNCCGVPCIMKRGTNTSITVEFTSDKNFTQMSQNMCAELSGTCVNMPGLPTDFCKYTTCPIAAGKPSTAKIELPILSTYPKVRMFCSCYIIRSISMPFIPLIR